MNWYIDPGRPFGARDRQNQERSDPPTNTVKELTRRHRGWVDLSGMTALQRIAYGWRTGELCEAADAGRCARAQPHIAGEYGCIWSDVAVFLPDDAEGAMARWTAERIGVLR